MTNYGPPQWQYPAQQWTPATPAHRPNRGTTMCRWSAFLGILSVVLGFILPIPILAVVFGIVGLARGSAIPGRAIIGIVFGWSGLTFWGAAIAIAIWSMHVDYA